MEIVFIVKIKIEDFKVLYTIITGVTKKETYVQIDVNSVEVIDVRTVEVIVVYIVVESFFAVFHNLLNLNV